MVYTPENNNECIVCQDETGKPLILNQHGCGNYFIHQECLNIWYTKHGFTCIICRKNIIDSDDSQIIDIYSDTESSENNSVDTGSSETQNSSTPSSSSTISIYIPQNNNRNNTVIDRERELKRDRMILCIIILIILLIMIIILIWLS